MKSFKQFMVEAHKKEKPKTKDPKHNIESRKKPVEFFAHYRSNDPKHNIEDKKLKEDFEEFLTRDYSKGKSIDSHNSMKHHVNINLAKGEGRSLLDYTHKSSKLNNALHNQKEIKDDSMKKQISDLDNVTNHPKNKLTSRAVTYSGVSPKFGKALSGVKEGETIKSRAFISSTLDPDVAHTFSLHKKDEPRHVIQFHLPKGYSKGRNINHASSNDGEDEFLLARNQTFRKTKEQHIDQGNGRSKFIIHHVEPIDEPTG